MPIDLQLTFRSGGKQLIDLLDYCIRSVQIDPLFLFLVQEYRNGPTAAKAVALYELFCAPNALAKISANKLLTIRLQGAISQLKASLQPPPAVPQPDPQNIEPIPVRQPLLPPKYLFEFVTNAVLEESDYLIQIEQHYQPDRTPIENLADGKMTMAQRHFVDKIWEPIVRPQLVQAGFWGIASVA